MSQSPFFWGGGVVHRLNLKRKARRFGSRSGFWNAIFIQFMQRTKTKETGDCISETKIPVAKPDGKRQKILWCRGMIILKCIRKQYGVMMCHGLIWLKVGTDGAGFREQHNAGGEFACMSKIPIFHLESSLWSRCDKLRYSTRTLKLLYFN